MKLVIDIPEEIYIEKREDYIGDTLDKAIANGTLLSEELEKIKAEINNIEPGYNFEGFYYCQSKVLDIIDERIEELKGENNDR